MNSQGKCPKCAKPLRKVQVEDVDIYVGDEKRFGGVSFSCRKCHTVISCSLDPIVLKAEIVGEILQALGKVPAQDITLI
jgi:hypothetical protein